MTLTRDHRAMLTAHAIDPDVALDLGVASVRKKSDIPRAITTLNGEGVPGLLVPWVGLDGPEVPQLRPDKPRPGRKYLCPSGVTLPLTVHPTMRDRVGGTSLPLLVVEGTRQHLAAVTALQGEDVGVLGMFGCWGWSHDGGRPTPSVQAIPWDGRTVYLALDGDMASKPEVWQAGTELAQWLESWDAAVKWVRLPNPERDQGMDDWLAAMPEGRRTSRLMGLVNRADPKPPAQPKPRHPYFGPDGLKAQKLADDIAAAVPLALNAEGVVCVYRGGVFRRDPDAIAGPVVARLGDRYRPFHRQAVEEIVRDRLTREGRVLPERSTEPLLNVANGMLDLRDLTLHPHDPKYLSWQQVPVEWDPAAECPTFDAWLDEQAGDQAEDLLESSSIMLDPTRTPTKAVMLYGPTRSGKSTYLRMLERLAGPENCSAVTLHQLTTNQFMAANVYGAVLNSAAELSSEHVEDLTVFKMMTGDDPIQGNRKYGRQFTFRNVALFAFSGNHVPSVGETSRAYLERVKPFKFERSFAGREDASIEASMVAELPGILRRLTEAYRCFQDRGWYQPTDPTVAEEFARRSDRVRAWVGENYRRTEKPEGTKGEVLHRAFNRWAAANKFHELGRNTFYDRLRSVEGVTEWKEGRTSDAAVFGLVEGSRGDFGSFSPLVPQEEASEQVTESGPPEGLMRENDRKNHTGYLPGLGRWSTDPSALAGVSTSLAAVDVETTGLGDDLRVRTVQVAAWESGGTPVCWLADVETDPSLVEVVDEVLGRFTRLVSFGTFDGRAFRVDGRFQEVEVTDASGLAHLHDPIVATTKGKKGLKGLMAAYELEDHLTPTTAEDTLTMTTTDPAFQVYAVTDALALLVLVREWTRDAPDQWWEWLRREHRVAEAADAMSRRGVAMDLGRLGELEQEYADAAKAAAEDATTLEPDLTNPRSSPQVVAAARRRGVDLPEVRRKRKDGTTYYSPTVGRKGLVSDDPFIQAIQRFRSKDSAATYVRGLVKASAGDGRIHARWRTLGARSSRWASADPNLQNVAKHGPHRAVRSAFVPSPGLVFVQADLSQIEYRVAAALSGDPGMLRAYQEGGDLHVYAAQVLNGVAEPTKAQRSAAKGMGFGKLYGQSATTAAKVAGVSVEAMEARLAEYDAAFPRLAEWCSEVQAEVQETGLTPPTPYGRKFKPEGAHAGVNYMCQPTARELFCDWLLAVDAEFPGAVVLAIHDEVVLEVDADAAAEVASKVAHLAAEATKDRPEPLGLVAIEADATVASHDWEEAYAGE